MAITVTGYSDLISDEYLNVARADAVAAELHAGHDLVAYAPNWLVGQKDYPTSDHDEIVAGRVVRETDQAYLLERDGSKEWFPKSQIRIYEATPDADLLVGSAKRSCGGTV